MLQPSGLESYEFDGIDPGEVQLNALATDLEKYDIPLIRLDGGEYRLWLAVDHPAAQARHGGSVAEADGPLVPVAKGDEPVACPAAYGRIAVSGDQASAAADLFARHLSNIEPFIWTSLARKAADDERVRQHEQLAERYNLDGCGCSKDEVTRTKALYRFAARHALRQTREYSHRNGFMYQAPSAPASIGGVLDDGFRLFKACFMDCLPFLILMGAAAAVPNMLMPGSAELQANPELLTEFLGPVVLLGLLVSFLAQALCFAATAAAIHRRVTEGSANLAGSFATGLARMPAVLIGGLIWALACGIGIVLLIIPGIWVSIAFLLFGYACVVDKAGPLKGLSASHNLIKGHWWRTAVIMSVVTLVVIVIYVLFGVAIGAIFGASIASGGVEAIAAVESSWLIVLATALLTIPMFMFLVATQYAIYADLKIRKEGGDLAARIEDV